MQKDKSGVYPVPELYDCEGSAMWRNKADNGISVYRTFDDAITEVHIQKIKYRYTGKQGTVLLKFIEESGKYADAGSF
jgi:twinkle protein